MNNLSTARVCATANARAFCACLLASMLLFTMLAPVSAVSPPAPQTPRTTKLKGQMIKPLPPTPIVPQVPMATFSNTATITTTLPSSCGAPPQPSTPYPSNITVSGLSGTVSDVNVTFQGMNFFEGDFEIMLVGPAGGAQNLMLLSDSGSVDVSNFTLTLDDAAASVLPQNGSWGTSPRTAKPTDYAELSGTDTFPSPAPSPINRPATTGSSTLASVFNGIAPNGTWSLYVITDVCDAPAETITGGWTLDITTSAGAATTTSVTSSVNPSTTGQSVTFTATVTSSGNPVTTGTVTFTEGATTLAANVAVNSSGQASFSTAALAEGNHIITASYNGTASFATSNGSVNQRVNNATIVNGSQYCNNGPITVNPLPNPATPYPSNIFVSGAAASLTKVTVTLKNVTHQFPDDIDALLVSPTGQNLVLVSDAGTTTSNVTVTFDDAAAGQLAQSAPWGAANSTVTSRPVDYDPAGQVDTFPAPAPAPSTATTLATFNGFNPNGTWSLYVVSDGAPDSGSIGGGWCVNVTAQPPTPPATPGQVIISEFRARGTAGDNDEFAELTNISAAAVDITGYTLRGSNNAGATSVLATVPAVTTLPPGGHYLFVNDQPTGTNEYSLATYPAGGTNAAPTGATGNLSYTTGIADDGGIAFVASDGTTIIDQVGLSTGSAYGEGTRLTSPGANGGQYAFVRKLTTGVPQDTANNAQDFAFVSTNGGSYGGVQSQLGAPGPENTASPIQRNAQIKASLIDQTVASTAAPNRVRTQCPTPGTCSSEQQFGTLDIRRKFTNTTGGSVTRLRFRVVDITTLNTPNGPLADMRLLTSSGTTANGGTITILGTTLETPPTQALGGGLNSSVTVALGGSLANGASVNVRFVLGVAQGGSFRFFVNVEALP